MFFFINIINIKMVSVRLNFIILTIIVTLPYCLFIVLFQIYMIIKLYSWCNNSPSGSYTCLYKYMFIFIIIIIINVVSVGQDSATLLYDNQGLRLVCLTGNFCSKPLNSVELNLYLGFQLQVTASLMQFPLLTSRGGR